MLANILGLDENTIKKFFEKYSKKDSKEKNLDFIVNENLKGICSDFLTFLEGAVKLSIEDTYQLAKNRTEKLNLNYTEFCSFCDYLPNFEASNGFKYNAGVYISCLIQKLSKEVKEFEISLHGLSEALWYIGRNLENVKLKVNGNVGHYFGTSANNCELIVIGDCGGWPALHATNSEIRITGQLVDFIQFIGPGTSVYHNGRLIEHYVDPLPVIKFTDEKPPKSKE